MDTYYACFVDRMQRGPFILKLGLGRAVAQTELLMVGARKVLEDYLAVCPESGDWALFLFKAER